MVHPMIEGYGTWKSGTSPLSPDHFLPVVRKPPNTGNPGGPPQTPGHDVQPDGPFIRRVRERKEMGDLEGAQLLKGRR